MTNITFTSGFIFIYSLLVTDYVLGQSQSSEWSVSIIAAFESVDERIVGIPNHRLENYRTRNNDNKPDLTRYIGLELGYRIINKKRINFELGLRYALERNNYFRPFNKCALKKPGEHCTYELRNLDIYSYNLLGISSNLEYIVNPVGETQFRFGISILPQIKFHSIYQEAPNTTLKRKHRVFDFFSLDASPYIGVAFKNFEIDIFYRMWQLKKVDRAIHTKWSDGHGAIENDYEFHNPLKIGLIVKYH